MAEKFKCVKAGQQYYATINNVRLTFLLLDGGEYVEVLTKNSSKGCYAIERFGGRLSPEGIRQFRSWVTARKAGNE